MKWLVLVSSAVFLAGMVAGCSTSDEPIEVTGEFGEPIKRDGWYPGESSSGGPCDALHNIRGLVWAGSWGLGEGSHTMWVSDERVTGEFEQKTDINWEAVGQTCVEHLSGTATLTNDNGTWTGDFEGSGPGPTPPNGGDFTVDYTLVGWGSYSGDRFSFHLEGRRFPWALTGTIEPGE
jgi:hypothetical protein